MITVQNLLESMQLIYAFTAVLFTYRVVKGPSIFDRVIAVDALSYDLIVFIALLALYFRQPMITLCIVPIALWAYILDLYVSWYYIEKTK